MGGPSVGKNAGPGYSWHDLNLSMMRGSKTTTFGEAAAKCTEKYEKTLSHGAARILKAIFSLGFNELARIKLTNNYKRDMETIHQSVARFYGALAPELEPESADGMWIPVDTMKYVNTKAREITMAGEKVTVTRSYNGMGTVECSSPKSGYTQTYDITDCDTLRSNIEQDVMRHAKLYPPEFVRSILKNHMDILKACLKKEKTPDKKLNLRSWGAPNSLLLGSFLHSQQVLAPGEAARIRLRTMLAAFYEGAIGLPTEVGETIDINLGYALVDKVLTGQITDPDKFRAFLDEGSRDVHLADAESQKIFAQFEKAYGAEFEKAHEAKKEPKIAEVTISKTYAQELDSKGEFVPKGDQKQIHDFVADLILNGDEYDYDKSIRPGCQTGTRLAGVIWKNVELVARMMVENDRKEMLKTLDPTVAKILNDSVLDVLEAGYKKSDKLKNDKLKYSREAYLYDQLYALKNAENVARAYAGTSDVRMLTDEQLNGYYGRENDQKIRERLKLDENEVPSEKRDRVQEALDFFGTIEAQIDEGVKDACLRVQAEISKKVDGIFKQPADKTSLGATNIAGMSLTDLQGHYSSDQDVKLLAATLKTYFQEMPPLAQRQMIAAQTRYCLHKTTAGDDAPSGVQLGALLKGAGPVMQKMLQGINPELIKDDDMKVALADMKDNLAPISQKAIQAYLFDIVEQGKNEKPPIESITVEKSLGQASVGQALLCKLKRQGLEPETVVVKLLRPNANLAARRERKIFEKAAEQIGGGMAGTFKGRYQSIMAELDLTAEAENMRKGVKVYDYSHNKAHPFTNVKSASLAPGCKPTSNTMVQKCAEGMTLKKVLTDEMSDLSAKNIQELHARREKLLATYSALENLSYMWAQEGLFGAGFYHGDLHDGNIMVDEKGGITVIDFGNATSLDANGRTNVIRVVAGMAVCDVDIFLQGFENLLDAGGQAAFADNRGKLREKLLALLENHRGIADTALRLDLALKIMQMDYGIEIPPAVHNFLESQRRLNDAMVNVAAKLSAVDKALEDKGETVKTKSLSSMTECLTNVVSHNVGLTLLRAIGPGKAKSAYESIKADLKSADAPPQKDAGKEIIFV